MDLAQVLLNQESQDAENDAQNKDQDKKKKKKKKSASYLKKMQAKQAEEARLNYIRQQEELLRQRKARVQAEWELNHAKAMTFTKEYEDSGKILQESCRKLDEINELWKEHQEKERMKNDWQRYLNCTSLPNPSSLPQINSYIYVWTELDKDYRMPECIKKTQEVMELLRGLEEILNESPPGVLPFPLKDAKEIRNDVRRHLQEHIDKATFYIFSRIETEMHPISISTSNYFAECPFFVMCLWAESYAPVAFSKRKEYRTPLTITFEEINLTITIPVKLLDIQKVIRAMWLNYDHWSDRCRTYECPPLPSYYERTLFEAFVTDHEMKKEILDFRALEEKQTREKVASLPPEPTVSQELMAWDVSPQKTVSDEVLFNECEQEDNLMTAVTSKLEEFEVNLRERTFLGEFLLLDVLHQPPQGQCFRLKHCITLRQEPPNLRVVDYYEVCSRIPEVVEVEEPEEDQENKEEPKINEHLSKLVSIELRLSERVIWFENPQPANWNASKGFWSMEDIYDVNVNDEERVMTFKTGRLGLMGLHMSTLCHFPYEDWMFEPNEEGGVNFYLKTPKTELLFRIQENKVCLEKMESGGSKALNWILGKYYLPFDLMQNLKKGGLNVFPAPDATGYMKTNSKHIVIERNIYHIWSLFSKSFRFKRSKYNQQVERGNIVFQAQEIYKNHQVDFCLIQTSMCSSYVLDITEESDTYSPEIVPGMEKYTDLYWLLINNSTTHAKREIEATSFLEIQTVKEFLSNVRPISFS